MENEEFIALMIQVLQLMWSIEVSFEEGNNYFVARPMYLYITMAAPHQY